MTTLPDRSKTALLVVDVQTDVVAGAFRRDEVVANIGDLVGRARSAGVAVVWVQHSADHMPQGTDGWQLVPELERVDPEPIVHKEHGDAFEDTSLEAELASRGVGRLVVAGAQTDACIRATLHGAFVRGYDTVLVSDAHTTEDLTEYGLPPVDQVITLTNMYWTWQTGPGRVAEVVDTAGVDFADSPEVAVS